MTKQRGQIPTTFFKSTVLEGKQEKTEKREENFPNFSQNVSRN